MLREFKLYTIHYITLEESEYFYEGEVPDNLLNINHYNVLFVRTLMNVGVSSVFTIEKNVAIFHGCLVDEVITWLTKKESYDKIMEHNTLPVLGIMINQCFGTGPSNAEKRFNEMRMEHNIFYF